MASPDDINSTLQGIARQLGLQAQSDTNALPVASAATSPRALAINNLGTSAGTVIVAASTTRHGIVFHNPGTSAIYIYPTAIQTTPTATALGGTLLIAAGSTMSFPSAQYPNSNCGWSAFATTGSSQSFTVIEFF